MLKEKEKGDVIFFDPHGETPEDDKSAFESFWNDNEKLKNIISGVNNGIMDKISIGEFAQLCFKEGFNSGCRFCDSRWIKYKNSKGITVFKVPEKKIKQKLKH